MKSLTSSFCLLFLGIVNLNRIIVTYEFFIVTDIADYCYL